MSLVNLSTTGDTSCQRGNGGSNGAAGKGATEGASCTGAGFVGVFEVASAEAAAEAASELDCWETGSAAAVEEVVVSRGAAVATTEAFAGAERETLLAVADAVEAVVGAAPGRATCFLILICSSKVKSDYVALKHEAVWRRLWKSRGEEDLSIGFVWPSSGLGGSRRLGLKCGRIGGPDGRVGGEARARRGERALGGLPEREAGVSVAVVLDRAPHFGRELDAVLRREVGIHGEIGNRRLECPAVHLFQKAFLPCFLTLVMHTLLRSLWSFCCENKKARINNKREYKIWKTKQIFQFLNSYFK